MSAPRQNWFRGLKSSSLFRPPPLDEHQRQTEIFAYVELFGQFASEAFGDDIDELVRSHYPYEACLLDDVLAMFILHHPEHGHAILHALLSCVIDGTLIYNKKNPPFGSFVSLFSPSSEKDLSEQWALACGETLRVLTHYNRPISMVKRANSSQRRSESSGVAASSSSSRSILENGTKHATLHQEQEKKTHTRLLTPWITDCLLAAPLCIRSDYFRWCGGVMGRYAAGGELKPPTTAGGRGPGKQPHLMPSTPRWAVANGAAVILSVCDDEVSRYETADLTAVAVPALLLPPPATALDEHLVAGLPPLEPYARLFHRYYAIATPGATQRLLLGLLEAPPSWAPDALDAAVQLVELLRAAEDYSSSMKLPRNWLHLHFLRPVGAAMAMRSGIAADAAAALLFRIFSQPALLFPAPRHGQGLQMDIAMTKAGEEATARGIASLICDHGPDVEWRICALWEAAYGLLPLNSSTVNLPELVVATPLQTPTLSWSLFRPLLRVLEQLSHGSPSETCLLRIFTATVESILCRTFPLEESTEPRSVSTKSIQSGVGGAGLAITELRTMVHSLFTEACPSPELGARLLSMALAVSLSHDAVRQGSKTNKRRRTSNAKVETHVARGGQRFFVNGPGEERGAVATFDSYIVAAVCALACEVQLLSFSSPMSTMPAQSAFLSSGSGSKKMHRSGSVNGSCNGALSAVDHARRLLSLLEALLALVPSTAYIIPGSSNSTSGEIVAVAVVAAHISELLGRSKACMNALTAIIRCKWESGLCNKATSLLALVEGNGKAVAAVVDNNVDTDSPKAVSADYSVDTDSPIYSPKVTVTESIQKPIEVDAVALEHETRIHPQSDVSQIQDVVHEVTLHACYECDREAAASDGEEHKPVNVALKGGTGKALAIIALDASDMASLVCIDRYNGANGKVGTLIKAVLVEKDLSVAAVPLLWQRLIYSPELPIGGEGTSAKRGWRRVVDALCKIVLALPGMAASAIVLQAERDLQPWVGREDAQGLQHVWRINKRIVNLLTELLRLHGAPEALKVVAKSSDLLHRATDGMAVDGEACALPQLEFLEAAITAAQVLAQSESSNEIVIDALSTLIKNRLPAIVRCLSHNSAHVRALSMALLRDALHAEPLSSRFPGEGGDSGQVCESGHNEWKIMINEWRRYVEQCVAWEIHNLRAMGTSISMLTNAVDSLGCSIPV